MRTLLLVLTLLTFAGPARAGTVTNGEPNNTFATAQDVTPFFSIEYDPNVVISVPGGYANTSLTVPHVTILRPGTSQFTENLDYFKFTTLATGPIVADITSTLAGFSIETNFDTHLFLFDEFGNLIASNDDKGDLSFWIPGDVPGALVGGSWNSRIETVPLGPGTYYVGVGLSFATALPGGQIVGGPFGGGDNPIFGSYTLNISAPIPEPATLLTLGLLGAAGGTLALRRKKKAAAGQM